MAAIHYYDIEYSEVFIYENYLVNQIKEGQSINPSHVKIVREIVDKHFADTSMIYLSNRLYSYAVDPLVYPEIAKIENLVAMGIVVYSDINRTNAQFERQFYTKPFEIFDDLNNAVIWAVQHLKPALNKQLHFWTTAI